MARISNDDIIGEIFGQTQLNSNPELVHPERIIASLHRDKVSLQLDTVELCFLVSLQIRTEVAGLVCFTEEYLIEEFEVVADQMAPECDSPRKRATHALQKLRDQRLLSRVDGAGLLRAGEYAMTRLAATIVEFYRSDQMLTRESLTLLMKELIHKLSEIKKSSLKVQTPEDWRIGVLIPLSVVVSEMVGGIERRQRGLDKHQEDVQRRIGDLLMQEWVLAIGKCEELLEETSNTLKELNTILMQDSNQIQTLLDEIHAVAETANAPDVNREIQRVSEQVDRITAWGGARQQAWSDYYEYVHRYLRDFVRLDPGRAMSERLRAQLSTYVQSPFGWIISRAPAIRLLRKQSFSDSRPPLSRPRQDRELQLEKVTVDTARGTLDEDVIKVLATGCSTLAGVLHQVLPHIADSGKFLATGRITRKVADAARPVVRRECKWEKVPGKIEVEDWELRIKKK